MDLVRYLISTNVRYYRQQAGITQAELGDLACISKRVIQTIEGGSHNVTVDVLCRIAVILRIDFSRLVSMPRFVLKNGPKKLDEINWNDGGTWAFGARYENGKIIETSKSFDLVTGVCAKAAKELPDATDLIKVVSPDSAVIKCPVGDREVSVVRTQLLGPDFEPLGWLTYGHPKGELKCAFQIHGHLKDVLRQVA
jgi:transcriptional regulator with XRE-family HTH domain